MKLTGLEDTRDKGGADGDGDNGVTPDVNGGSLRNGRKSRNGEDSVGGDRVHCARGDRCLK